MESLRIVSRGGSLHLEGGGGFGGRARWTQARRHHPGGERHTLPRGHSRGGPQSKFNFWSAISTARPPPPLPSPRTLNVAHNPLILSVPSASTSQASTSTGNLERRCETRRYSATHPRDTFRTRDVRTSLLLLLLRFINLSFYEIVLKFATRLRPLPRSLLLFSQTINPYVERIS